MAHGASLKRKVAMLELDDAVVPSLHHSSGRDPPFEFKNPILLMLQQLH